MGNDYDKDKKLFKIGEVARISISAWGQSGIMRRQGF